MLQYIFKKVMNPSSCKIISMAADHLRSYTARATAGAHPTNDISIEFKILSKLGVL